MVIRKYIATTEEEATKLAKEELGESAVIMNVKKVMPRGLARFFKKASVEITAAVDEVESNEKKDQESNRAFVQDLPDFGKLQEAIQETNAVLAAEEAKKETEQGGSLFSGKANAVDGAGVPKEASEAGRNVAANEEAGKKDIEERLSNLQDLLEKQLQADRAAKEEKEEKENTSQAY